MFILNIHNILNKNTLFSVIIYKIFKSLSYFRLFTLTNFFYIFFNFFISKFYNWFVDFRLMLSSEIHHKPPTFLRIFLKKLSIYYCFSLVFKIKSFIN